MHIDPLSPDFIGRSVNEVKDIQYTSRSVNETKYTQADQLTKQKIYKKVS